MMKTVNQILRGKIHVLFRVPIRCFIVGAALRRDSSKPSWRKAAPTTGHRTSRLGFLIFAVAALTAAAETPAPELSLSFRGVGDNIVEQGEPLRITVRLSVPRKFSGEVKLAPATGSWSDAIAVELASVKGGAVVARGALVGQPSTPHATLSAEKIAGGLWVISSASMKPLAPGEYVVRARLAIKGGPGWNGEVDTDEIPLRVVAISETAYRVAQRVINLAHEALLAGHLEAAAAMIDPVLQRTPDDVRLLTVRADIAERAGNPLAALMCLSQAKRAAPPGGVGPPAIEREALEARARESFQGDKTPSMNPPTWSWPPAAVLAISEDEMLGFGKAKGGTSPAMPVTAKAPAVGVPGFAVPPAAVPPSAPATVPANPIPVVAVGASSSGVIVPSAELVDAKIIADPNGQWAVTATASSQYGQSKYAPAQATGAPNIPLGMAGDNADAWCPLNKNNDTEWLEVSFTRPFHATEMRVRQNNAPGAIAKIEVIEPDGTGHVWWEGVDPFVAPNVRKIAWFAVRVPKTPYLVAKVKITLNLSANPGWKQIDAVQLVGAGE
jgi:hypothetical protein